VAGGGSEPPEHPGDPAPALGAVFVPLNGLDPVAGVVSVELRDELGCPSIAVSLLQRPSSFLVPMRPAAHAASAISLRGTASALAWRSSTSKRASRALRFGIGAGLRAGRPVKGSHAAGLLGTALSSGGFGVR